MNIKRFLIYHRQFFLLTLLGVCNIATSTNSMYAISQQVPTYRPRYRKKHQLSECNFMKSINSVYEISRQAPPQCTGYRDKYQLITKEGSEFSIPNK